MNDGIATKADLAAHATQSEHRHRELLGQFNQVNERLDGIVAAIASQRAIFDIFSDEHDKQFEILVMVAPQLERIERATAKPDPIVEQVKDFARAYNAAGQPSTDAVASQVKHKAVVTKKRGRRVKK